ncbi:hypothetical protein BCR36DRAFT_296884 [Piromyces finnis]|uniref:Uncharacterized protein n=1 Tax=Piromyces finnis TaxID=1754191 RepID=A0A1Y1V4M6_9FUNG|nr:hypothetical protein BCR36DRAFT_296884 [Piromyces finnis]|eukprot:ORX46587.1 hypothetical protein BCR36DRAFT_296884 [Piromyces finnis]
MFSKKIEGESIDKNNKYANLTKPRTSPLDFSSPIPTKKNHSINEKNNYSISVINKLKNLNNSFSIEQENNNNNSMSYQSDSNIKYNNAPSTSSSLVDKMFITQTASKKIHFNPNDFSNPDSSFYVNSDSILKSNMSISSVDSLNENYNIKTKRDSKKIDNSEYIRKIEEENSKLEDEINKLKEEFKKINNILQKNKIHVEEIEQSNKLEIENLNNEIEKKNKVINQLKDKNEYLLNEVQEKKESIEEYKILNQSLKKDKNNYESKFKNSEVIIQNLKEENAKINEENFELKEQIEILSDISIEKEKLANENEHLRQIAEELDIKNENTMY